MNKTARLDILLVYSIVIIIIIIIDFIHAFWKETKKNELNNYVYVSTTASVYAF